MPAHEELRNFLHNAFQADDFVFQVADVLFVAANKDQMIRQVMHVLAAYQGIPLARKDMIRKELRAFYREQFGDRAFFADSDIHRIKIRQRLYG